MTVTVMTIINHLPDIGKTINSHNNKIKAMKIKICIIRSYALQAYILEEKS
jgi:hypothetical protein